jgi:tape measure domain-containing protein
MATVQSAIVMQDRMSGVMKGVIKAVQHTINTMEELNRTSNRETVARGWGKAKVEINAAAAALRKFDNELGQIPAHQRRVTQGFESWKGSLTALAAGIYTVKAAFQGIKSITDQIDMSTSMQARLGLLTDSKQGTQQLMDSVFEAAERSRGSYADMGAQVAKLGLLAGKNFADNSEIVAFAETMNKAFVVGGASATEQASAMYQLTQAMASGRLQGDEYRSIIENAPMLAQSIEDYMRNTVKAKGTMKEWAAEGLLTADVIKVALFNAADDINAKFAEMPITFAQFWQSIKNHAFQAFQPLMAKITEIANNKAFQNFIKKIIQGLVTIADVIMDIVNFLSEHKNALMGVIAGITGAVVIGTGAWISYKFAVLGAAEAQAALNRVIALCPWMALVSGVTFLIMKLHELYKTNEKVRFGMELSWAGFKTMLDKWKIGYEYISQHVTGTATPESMSALAEESELAGWIRTAEAWYKTWAGSQPLINGAQYVASKEDIMRLAKKLLENYNAGINSLAMEAELKATYFDSLVEKANKEIEEGMLSSAEKHAIDGGYLNKVDEIGGEVDISKESLVYLVDGITGKYINNINLSSPAPTVTVNLNGNISSEVDAEGLVQQISDGVLEANSAGTDKAYDY